MSHIDQSVTYKSLDGTLHIDQRVTYKILTEWYILIKVPYKNS